MKIYTDGYGNNIGLVLVNDKNEIYLMEGLQTQTIDKESTHLLAIKRALSFLKNVKPLYANNDIELLNGNGVSILDKALKDEYVVRALTAKNIQMVEKQPSTNFDKQMLMIAKQQRCWKNNRLEYER
nr:MAG TPA: hypothetical protein [Caudoviricetes sp.]